MNRPTRLLICTICVLAGVCCLALTATATQFDSGDRLHISNLHNIQDDYVSWSEKLLIDGLIDGDVISGAGEVTINGTISGSANLFGARVNHFGTIDRSLRIFTQHADIDGSIGGSIMSFASDVTLGKPCRVSRDVSAFGESFRSLGTIGGNVMVYATDVSLSGRIMGDIKIEAERFEIIAPAIIEGNISYESESELFIDDTSGVTINGSIEWIKPSEQDDGDDRSAVAGISMAIGKLLAAFIFGIIMMALSRRHAKAAFKSLQNRVTTSLAAGVVTLLALVVAAVALVISLSMLVGGAILATTENATLGALIFSVSLIGLPISSFISVAGGVLFYSGKIMAGFVLGYLILCRRKPDCLPLGKGQLFLGLLILTVIFAIPYLGIVIYLAVSIIGMGAIVLGIRHCQQMTSYTEEERPSPPPPTPPGSSTQ